MYIICPKCNVKRNITTAPHCPLCEEVIEKRMVGYGLAKGRVNSLSKYL
jgi:uncharacterized protein YlaN (UPF0358 family)